MVARLGLAPLRTVQTARLLQAAVPVSATFAVPFCSRPDPAEDDVSDHRYLLCLHDAHPFSSGALFPGWKELAGSPVFWLLPPTYHPLMVVRPRTWLLHSVDLFHPLISVQEVPGT